MANNIFQVKRTSTSGRTPNTTGSYATNSQYIAAGEFALNMADGILYSSNGSSPITIGANQVNQNVSNTLTVKAISANGGNGSSGQVLTTNGTATYWSTVTSGGVNADAQYTWTNVQTHANTVIFNNNQQLRFKTVNTSASVYFTQQNDDNFVFYTTDASYNPRAVFSIFANSSTSDFQLGQPTSFTGTNVKISTTTSLIANGTSGSAGQYLTSNGTTVYWSSPGAASVNTSAQYSWTNTHSFSANVTFSGNGIGLTTNTSAIYLGGIADANWKIGRNTGVVTKWRYTNNSIDIITANSNLEGMSIGLVSGNSYFETGYLGTYIASNLTIGNTTSNSTINSTAFSGTANNTNFVGTVSAANVVSNAQLSANLANYQTTAGLAANVATLAANSASYTTSIIGGLTGSMPYQAAASVTSFVTIGSNTFIMTSNGSAPQWSNPTSITVGTANLATYLGAAGNFGNSTGIYTSGTINAASYTVGTNFVANTTALTVNVPVTANQAQSNFSNTAVEGHIELPYGNFIYELFGINAKLNTNTGSAGFRVKANTDVELFTVLANGNVGIGDSSPNAPLVVNRSQNSATSFSVRNTNTGSGAQAVMQIAVGSSSGMNFTVSESGQYTVISPYGTAAVSSYNDANVHVFRAMSGVEKLRFDVSGNVGIGNTSPAHKLRVEGALSLSDGIHANGSFGTAGDVLTSNGSSVYWTAAAGGGGVYMKGGSSTIGTLGSEGQNIFRVNANTLNNDTTIATGENAQATGPLVVASGKTLTIQTDARVSIV